MKKYSRDDSSTDSFLHALLIEMIKITNQFAEGGQRKEGDQEGLTFHSWEHDETENPIRRKRNQ